MRTQNMCACNVTLADLYSGYMYEHVHLSSAIQSDTRFLCRDWGCVDVCCCSKQRDSEQVVNKRDAKAKRTAETYVWFSLVLFLAFRYFLKFLFITSYFSFFSQFI